jgi:hypothetical protein
MSATHRTLGAAGVNCRATRSSGDPDSGNADRRAAPLLGHEPGDRGVAHQPLDALAPNPDALGGAQLGVDAPRAVDAAVGGVDGLDALGQPRVGQRALRRRPPLPVVIARAADPSSSQATETGVRAFSAEINR